MKKNEMEKAPVREVKTDNLDNVLGGAYADATKKAFATATRSL